MAGGGNGRKREGSRDRGRWKLGAERGGERKWRGSGIGKEVNSSCMKASSNVYSTLSLFISLYLNFELLFLSKVRTLRGHEKDVIKVACVGGGGGVNWENPTPPVVISLSTDGCVKAWDVLQVSIYIFPCVHVSDVHAIVYSLLSSHSLPYPSSFLSFLMSSPFHDSLPLAHTPSLPPFSVLFSVLSTSSS